jgi:hypothetical protein
MYFLLAFILSVPAVHHTAQPIVTTGTTRLIQPDAPLQMPTSLTLYKSTGEQIAVCKCSFVGTEPTLTACEIEKGFTLDDVMNSWLDAYSRKTELEAPDK